MADTRFKKFFSKTKKENPPRFNKSNDDVKKISSECLKKPLSPEDSYEDLKRCFKANCCNCCYSLLQLFKELFKAVGGDSNNRVCDVLGDMSDLILAIISDMFFFVKRCCFCLYDNVTTPNTK